MRTSEEVARQAMQAQCTNCRGTLCMGCVLREYDHDCQDDCPDCCGEVDGDVLDLIRARDAEVRADERAKVLAGFTEERTAFFEHDEGTGRLRRSAAGIPYRRLVAPWVPDA